MQNRLINVLIMANYIQFCKQMRRTYLPFNQASFTRLLEKLRSRNTVHLPNHVFYSFSELQCTRTIFTTFQLICSI